MRLESSGVFFFTGMSLSQTTPTPAVTSTTPFVNVTTLTVTPMILSSTTPGCTTFNTSTCESCAPGSLYDNSKPSRPPCRFLHFWMASCLFLMSWKRQSLWSLFLCRHPHVFMLFCPRAVSISWSVPAMRQRLLSAPIRTTTVLALQPRLLRKVHTLCLPSYWFIVAPVLSTSLE